MTVMPASWPAVLLIVAYCPQETTASLSPGRFGVLPYKVTATPSCHDHRLHRIRGGAAIVDVDDNEDDEGDSDEYDVEEDGEDDVAIAAVDDDGGKLAASTRTVSSKRKTADIKTRVKVAMMSSSSSSGDSAPPKSKSTSRKSFYKRHVPHIIRACLNPYTLIAMTRAYFVSLCDINFMKEGKLGPERTECTSFVENHTSHNGHTIPHFLFACFKLSTLGSHFSPSLPRPPGPIVPMNAMIQRRRMKRRDARRQQSPSSGGPTRLKRKMKPGQAKTLSDLPQLSA
ncbi:hypothetical protein ACHAXA_002289 [Cyclostephanos tholiformis]|uniref:Uncharacterized protein n=1 Tax=Cyclostephanos tholiformis TaxID=382380 RepID=A0ABD3RF95_9STRA